MLRLIFSTCGVLTEVAIFDPNTSTTGMLLAASGVVLALAVLWTDVRPLIDRLVGLDL